MSKFDEIETFVRVVEAGSITAAAQQLQVAKSAVSRRLKELETRLNTQLVLRTTRKLTLTDTGQALYERALGILADWAETESLICEAQTELTGTVRMTMPLSFGIAHIGPAILDFMKQHPGLKFDIELNDRRVDLITEGLDLAIRVGNLPDSSFIARKLAPISTVVAASPAFLEKHGTPQTPADLKQLDELAYRYRAETSWHYIDPTGAKGQVELKPRVKASNGVFLCNLAVAGAGFIIEPRFIIHEQLRDGSLVQILKDYEWPHQSVYALYPPTRHLSARVRTFVDFLANRFKGTPYWEQ